MGGWGPFEWEALRQGVSRVPRIGGRRSLSWVLRLGALQMGDLLAGSLWRGPFLSIRVLILGKICFVSCPKGKN